MSIAQNEDIPLFPSASRTTTVVTPDLRNIAGMTNLTLVLDVTNAGTGSVTISIDGKDTASGKYINLLTGTAVTTNGTVRYRVGPYLGSVANSVAFDIVPPIYKVTIVHNNANAITYSVGLQLCRN